MHSEVCTYPLVHRSELLYPRGGAQLRLSPAAYSKPSAVSFLSLSATAMDVEAMDEKQARQRLLEGGYFVALGVPPGVEFGIDLKSYTVGGIRGSVHLQQD